MVGPVVSQRARRRLPSDYSRVLAWAYKSGLRWRTIEVAAMPWQTILMRGQGRFRSLVRVLQGSQSTGGAGRLLRAALAQPLAS